VDLQSVQKVFLEVEDAQQINNRIDVWDKVVRKEHRRVGEGLLVVGNNVTEHFVQNLTNRSWFNQAEK